VIKGFTEALVHMPVGSTWEVYIPQELAYGERQAGQIKPFSALIFKIELQGIK
jgi:FKBP-type peptidyl-prolyl cis-trans isomerase FklB